MANYLKFEIKDSLNAEQTNVMTELIKFINLISLNRDHKLASNS